MPPSPPCPAVELDALTKTYGERRALDALTLSVAPREIVALLGPNGSGKSTLFRILATLLPATGGHARIFGHDVHAEPEAVRRHLGVVFQHPSLDPKLTATENLRCHGRLFGLRGAPLAARVAALLERFGLAARADERVEAFSGGMRRRVELGKALLAQPDLLLLDEPSTGLDPGARRDLTAYLEELRARDGLTVLLTTHILDEAERADRVAILHDGQLVALGAPDALKASVGGDVVVVEAAAPEALQGKVEERFGHRAALVRGRLRLELPRAHEFVRELVDAFPGEVRAVSFGRPTLEDVFVRLVGHGLDGHAEEVE